MSTQTGLGRVISGFAALAVATLLTQVLNFVLLAIAARRLGPEPIGAFSFAVSVVGYFAIPSNFGITGLATRDVAREPGRMREVLAQVVPLHGATVLIPYALAVVTAPLLGADALSARLFPIVALGFVLDAVSLQWIAYGRQRFTVIALARVAGAVVNFVLVILLVRPGSGGEGAVAFAWAGTAGLFLTSVWTLVAAVRREGRPRLSLDVRALLRRFRAGMPLGVSSVMIAVYYSLDSVMLGYLRGTEEVGQYAVAYKLPLALIGLAGLWGSVLFPHAAALMERDPEDLRGQLGFFSSVAVVVALPLGVGALLVGQDLMPQLFGARFAPAGTPFVILCWATAIVVFTISTATAALAVGADRLYVTSVTAGAVANLLLNFAVIPLFGTTGAAAATVSAEVVVFAMVWGRVGKRLGRIELEWGRIARAAAATALMVPVVLALDGTLAGVQRAAVGAVVYAVAAVGFGAIRIGELRKALGTGS